jgi:hypothetical protein
MLRVHEEVLPGFDHWIPGVCNTHFKENLLQYVFVFLMAGFAHTILLSHITLSIDPTFLILL